MSARLGAIDIVWKLDWEFLELKIRSYRDEIGFSRVFARWHSGAVMLRSVKYNSGASS